MFSARVMAVLLAVAGVVVTGIVLTMLRTYWPWYAIAWVVVMAGWILATFLFLARDIWNGFPSGWGRP